MECKSSLYSLHQSRASDVSCLLTSVFLFPAENRVNVWLNHQRIVFSYKCMPLLLFIIFKYTVYLIFFNFYSIFFN